MSSEANSVMAELGQEQLKTALALASARVKDTADALERIWTVLLVCGVGGVILVYDIADLKSVICKYLSDSVTCTVRSAAPIFLAVVFYYFVKLGQHITSFLEARMLLDRLLAQHLGANWAASVLMRPIRESTSFFEGFYSKEAFRSEILQVAYFFVAILVVASGQASALFLLLQGYGASTWSRISFAVCALGLVILYLGFWKSKHEHPYAKTAVLSSVAGIIILFAVFHSTAPNTQPANAGPLHESPRKATEPALRSDFLRWALPSFAGRSSAWLGRMTQLSLPIRSLIRENTAAILTFAFSRTPLKSLFEGGFVGDWKTLEKTLFELTQQRAERACLELALLLRYLDDEEEFGAHGKERTNFSFGRLISRGGDIAELQLRDVANKIIHASGFEWTLSPVTQQPMLACLSRNEEKWLRAEIELVNLAAVCGNIADANET